MSQVFRLKRVEQEIKRFIGEFISRDLKDPRVKGVSITKVEVSKDLRWAWVYVSIYGVPDPVEVMDGLQSAKGFIRRELGRELRLRIVPEIVFKEDRSIDYSFHIERILSEVSRKDGKENDDEGDNGEDKAS
ncbi:MAG: 30S ribosome-binding factor RbfA [Synergistetes bacterium]|nr:30S ribosome-binding factor RbfA [Synergistota bacterium]MCX8128188.1 30S ribosome-binding factor RbfA [Synergistota bacterium]MDW8192564.1 30S ribosome-binding factor RbfA [Synergistota bacterium]